MALLNLENEFNKALRMDGPISKGPAMRWQRKLNEGSGANNSSNGSLLQLNASLSSGTCTTVNTPSRLRRSLSTSNIQKDSDSNKSTPTRRSRTPGRFLELEVTWK